MRLCLIRHGKTPGNLQRRYIGKTDESLCADGIRELKAAKYPGAEAVFASPMKRCLETAGILYPEQQPMVFDGFRECDFGEFENKNYQELNGSPAYQDWLDSGGSLPFPGGESREQVTERTCCAFRRMLSVCGEKHISSAALVVHGGTIMTILEQFAVPKRDYYDWQVQNGCGFQTEVKTEHETVIICVIAGLPS